MEAVMRAFRGARRERGVVLFIALIVLVAMSLAGIALMRGVDNVNLIAGNLAFKQGAAYAADWGVEQARAWLSSQSSSTLWTDQPNITGGAGYWANAQQNVDFTGTDSQLADYNWSTAVNLGADANGNQVRYVIHRLCEKAGSPESLQCLRGGATSSVGTKAGATYSSFALAGTSQVYYRVTVRVVGPRNTVSYVQVVLR
jgi:Tfp pilus assembly protein PilX